MSPLLIILEILADSKNVSVVYGDDSRPDSVVVFVGNETDLEEVALDRVVDKSVLFVVLRDETDLDDVALDEVAIRSVLLVAVLSSHFGLIEKARGVAVWFKKGFGRASTAMRRLSKIGRLKSPKGERMNETMASSSSLIQGFGGE